MEIVKKGDPVQNHGLRGTVEQVQPSDVRFFSWIVVRLTSKGHRLWGKWDSRNVSKVPNKIKR